MIKSSIICFLLLKKNVSISYICALSDDIMIESIKIFLKTFFLIGNVLEKTKVGGYFKSRVYVCVCRKSLTDKKWGRRTKHNSGY